MTAKRLILVSVFLFVALPGWQIAVAQKEVKEKEPVQSGDKLSAIWHGTWAGKITVHAPDGTTFTRGMELTIEPKKGAPSYNWRMVSDFRGKTTVRDYELVPESDARGHFKIDEKNGIVLDAWLVDRTIYTYYKDGEILINARYELREEGIFIELASVETEKPRISTLKGEGFQVSSYRLGSVQSGILQRKGPE